MFIAVNHKSQKVEKSRMPIHGKWIEKQKVVFPHNDCYLVIKKMKY